ncbi:hypothetical protein VNO77_25790 [Canavalia gladiata]|uniref:Uncharacterized protein n=1 Tax=Canavalia gladiata TaxID=3824 RepID=A0AAN9KSM1_CANGL
MNFHCDFFVESPSYIFVLYIQILLRVFGRNGNLLGLVKHITALSQFVPILLKKLMVRVNLLFGQTSDLVILLVK